MTGDLLGTLRYMSPEQAEGRSAILDHRTDIYSLGVTLYELLTLRPAFAADDRQTLLKQIADEELISPRKLNNAIPTDLETVLLKCCEKEPARRYPSARELAEDFHRFLNEKPISAKPPTVAQRAAKWSRRHSSLVASCAAVLLVSTIGLMTAATMLSQAYKSESAALEKARNNLALARHAANEMTAAAETWLADRPHVEPVHRAFVLKALSLYDQLATETDPPAEQLDVARAQRLCGDMQFRFGNNPASRAAYRAAILRLKPVVVEARADRIARSELAKAYYGLGVSLSADSWEGVEELHQKALDVWTTVLAESPGDAEATFFIVKSKRELIRKHGFQGHWANATRELRSADGMIRDLLRKVPTSSKYAAFWALLSIDMTEALVPRHPAEAVEHAKLAIERAELAMRLAPADPFARRVMCEVHHFYGCALHNLGEFTEAITSFERAIAIRTPLTEEFPHWAEVLGDLGDDHACLAESAWRCGKLTVARSNFERAADHYDKLWQNTRSDFNFSDSWRGVETYTRFLSFLDEIGLSDEVTTRRVRATRVLQDLVAQAHAGWQCNALAWYLVRERNATIREPLLAVRLAKRATGLDQKNASYWHTLGIAQYRAGQHREAIESLLTSMKLAGAANSSASFFLAMAHWQLGEQKQAMQAFSEAVEGMEKDQFKNERLIQFRFEAEELLRFKAEANKAPVSTTRAQD